MQKKLVKMIVVPSLAISLLFPTVSLAASSYSVASGDTLWKIAVKTTTGIDELIQANPQIPNINMIYPGQKINVPSQNGYSVEQEVIRLVNQERAKSGLAPLKYDWELARVAEHKSLDMRSLGYFSHNSPTYGSPFDMMKNYGIHYKQQEKTLRKGKLLLSK